MDIHVHNYVDTGKIESKLDSILRKLGGLMAKVDDLNAELIAANEATNEIAADVDALVARLAGGLTEVEATDVQAKLSALTVRLKAVAAVHTPGSVVEPDPANVSSRR